MSSTSSSDSGSSSGSSSSPGSSTPGGMPVYVVILSTLVALDVLAPWVLSLGVRPKRPDRGPALWVGSGYLCFVAFATPMKTFEDRGDRRLFIAQMGLTLSAQFEVALQVVFSGSAFQGEARRFRFFVFMAIFLFNALLFWPIFLTSSQLHRRVGRVYGLLYCIVLLFFYVYNVYDLLSTADSFGVYVAAANAPSIVCGVLVLVYYLYLLFWKREPKTMNGPDFSSVHDAYVKRLLLPASRFNAAPSAVPVPVEPWWRRLVRTYLYDFDGDREFRFPTRLLTACLMLLLTAYLLTSYLALELYDILAAFSDNAGSVSREVLQYFYFSIITVAIVSLVIAALQVVQVLQAFKSHTKRLRRGDYSFVPGGRDGHGVDVNDTIRFIGFSIAFGFVGYAWIFAVMQLLVSFVYFFVTSETVRDIIYDLLFTQLIFVPFLSVFVFNQAQIWLVRLVFLEKGERFVVRHRQWFSHVEYFSMFVNVLRGLFAFFFSRMFLPIIGSMLLSFRMDKRILPEGLEFLDGGQSSYLGMLLADHTHNNPIVTVAVRLLKPESERYDRAADGPQEHPSTDPLKAPLLGSPADEESAPLLLPVPRSVHARRRRNRWHLALTLLNNPGLVWLRRRTASTC